MLMMRDTYSDIALPYGYFYISEFDKVYYNIVISILFKESILANVGGEFGIGGLFYVATQKRQNTIHTKWDGVLPVLESTLESLLEEEKEPPILQAAILAKAPLYAIQGTINQFEYSILKVDSFGRYLIEVALEEGLQWIEGLQEVDKATSMARPQHPRIIQFAAQYGLKWRHHMKDLAEANVDEIVNGYECLTALRLLMVAALDDNHD